MSWWRRPFPFRSHLQVELNASGELPTGASPGAASVGRTSQRIPEVGKRSRCARAPMSMMGSLSPQDAATAKRPWPDLGAGWARPQASAELASFQVPVRPRSSLALTDRLLTWRYVTARLFIGFRAAYVGAPVTSRHAHRLLDADRLGILPPPPLPPPPTLPSSPPGRWPRS